MVPASAEANQVKISCLVPILLHRRVKILPEESSCVGQDVTFPLLIAKEYEDDWHRVKWSFMIQSICCFQNVY